MRRLFFILSVLLLACVARAAEVIPPVPEGYYADYAGVTSAATAARLNRELDDFERRTSNQIVAAIYPKMESDSSVDDYCIRVANAWKAGRKGKNNGAVLFVFVNDRKMFIATGYGLEGALPDATCKLIIENEIKPRFKALDYDGGMVAGVEAIMAATRGEYKGTGRTVHDGMAIPVWVPPLLFFIVIVVIQRVLRRYTTYGSSGRRGGWYVGGLGGGGWGGGSSGTSGGSWGGGGGGFSGGGGSFGGGGAGGSW